MSKILKYLFFVTVIILSMSAVGIGDVGDFNDYDSGSSWSDSSDDWSSSNDWSSSDSDGNSINLNDVSLPIGTGWGLGIFILLLTVAVIKAAIKQSKNGPSSLYNTPSMYSSGQRWPNVPDNSQKIIEELCKDDPGFNATSFLEWAKEVFIKLQYAWRDRDWEQVRPFESEELFAQHQRQLQEYTRMGRINMIERVNVNNAYFFSLVKDREFETLSVVMNVRMIDYIIDEQTKQILKGSKDNDCFLSYFYVFKRKAGIKTISAKQGFDTIACPNCGAPTHVVSSGKCEYCNFVIKVKDHGWVLADIKGIKPPYNYGTGGVTIQNKSEE